jgi:hypothetical protein
VLARRVDEESRRPTDFCAPAGSGFLNYVILRYVELRNSFSGQHARGSIGAGGDLVAEAQEWLLYQIKLWDRRNEHAHEISKPSKPK